MSGKDTSRRTRTKQRLCQGNLLLAASDLRVALHELQLKISLLETEMSSPSTCSVRYARACSRLSWRIRNQLEKTANQWNLMTLAPQETESKMASDDPWISFEPTALVWQDVIEGGCSLQQTQDEAIVSPNQETIEES